MARGDADVLFLMLMNSKTPLFADMMDWRPASAGLCESFKNLELIRFRKYSLSLTEELAELDTARETSKFTSVPFRNELFVELWTSCSQSELSLSV